MFSEINQSVCSFCVVFFPEVGGSTLDSHHGFIVEYGNDRDVDLGKCFVYRMFL